MSALATLNRPVQNQLILDYLKSGRQLSNLVALTNLGIGSLTSRIAELRKEGQPIEAAWKEDFGGKRYRAYTMATSAVPQG